MIPIALAPVLIKLGAAGVEKLSEMFLGKAASMIKEAVSNPKMTLPGGGQAAEKAADVTELLKSLKVTKGRRDQGQDTMAVQENNNMKKLSQQSQQTPRPRGGS